MADDIYSHLICGGKLAYLELKDKIVFITLFASVLTLGALVCTFPSSSLIIIV